MLCRFSVYVKGIVPLEAYVSKQVQVLNAPKPFNLSEDSFGDEGVHMCSVISPDETFSSLPDHENLSIAAKGAIQAALRTFQVKFGPTIKQANEELKRAIYSVDIQFTEDNRARIQGFSFAPSENLNYAEAFKALFFDEVADLDTIW